MRVLKKSSVASVVITFSGRTCEQLCVMREQDVLHEHRNSVVAAPMQKFAQAVEQLLRRYKTALHVLGEVGFFVDVPACEHDLLLVVPDVEFAAGDDHLAGGWAGFGVPHFGGDGAGFVRKLDVDERL